MLILAINAKQTLSTQQMFQMFWTIQKLSRQYGNFPDNTETFQTIKQISGQYGNVPDSQKTLQTIWKLAKQYRNFPDNK